MNQNELKDRTKQFAVRVIRLSDALPRKMAADVIGRQLIRSATSVAANHRAACRGKSRADFISKMGTVEEEADESGLWLELLGDSGLMPVKRLTALQQEADALTAIVVSSIRTARSRSVNPQSVIRSPQSA